MTNKSGRRLKADGTAFPIDEVDALLVHGEEQPAPHGPGTIIAFPSYRQIADRYEVAHSLIANYARSHNCLNRRKQAQKRVDQMAETKLMEYRADRLALKKDDMIRVIDGFILDFEKALKEGRVRCDNPSDLNLMIRLKCFLLGDADSRKEVIKGITLEDIQRRHKDYLKRLREVTPEMTGMVVPCRVVEKVEEEKQIESKGEVVDAELIEEDEGSQAESDA